MNTLTITTIQTNLFWEDKTANMQMLQQKIESIATKTEIVVLPEMFTTGFSMNAAYLAETMNGETISWMQKICAKNKIILTGSIIIKEEEKFYNRLIWMLPNGQLGFYDKRHLFAYADENKYYSAGSKRLIALVKGFKINLQICYDLRFPVWARQGNADNAEYDILIYVANWPQQRSHAWSTLLCARAIENQCYVVGVNRVGNDASNIYYSGNTLVIDPMGQVLYHMTDDEDVNTITLYKEKLDEVRTKFPFLNDADEFTFGTK